MFPPICFVCYMFRNEEPVNLGLKEFLTELSGPENVFKHRGNFSPKTSRCDVMFSLKPDNHHFMGQVWTRAFQMNVLLFAVTCLRAALRPTTVLSNTKSGGFFVLEIPFSLNEPCIYYI